MDPDNPEHRHCLDKAIGDVAGIYDLEDHELHGIIARYGELVSEAEQNTSTTAPGVEEDHG